MNFNIPSKTEIESVVPNKEDAEKVHKKLVNKKSKCKAENREINLSLDFVKDNYVAMLGGGLCAYTGKPFDIFSGDDEGGIPTLERKDNAFGYTDDNTIVVRKDINSMKGTIEAPDAVRLNILAERGQLLLNVFAKAANKNPEIIEKVVIKEVEECSCEEVEPIIITEDTNEDVAISVAYLNFSQEVEKSDKTFNVTFGKFKRMYKSKRCFVSGLLDSNKVPVLIVDSEIVTDEDFKFVSEEVKPVIEELMKVTGQDLSTISKNMNKILNRNK